MITNTFVCPIIQPHFIGRMLETLYKYTQKDTFRVIVIDNTGGQIDGRPYMDKVHFWITSYRNLGFSKSANTGILLSQTPYITIVNDDIEFMNSGWWQGVLDTFARDKKIIAVNPNSPKEGAWGYGQTADNKDTWKPREGFIYDGDKSVLPVINGKVFEYKEEYTQEEYDSLLNNHPIWQKGTLCDALACSCTVFSREGLEEIGLFDERFYPAGGEDYDMMARIYSCGYPEKRTECDEKFHRRAVGTTLSWVWHHWGKSKDDISGKDPTNKLFESRPRWNANEELWDPDLEVWGHLPQDGKNRPITRKSPVFIDEL